MKSYWITRKHVAIIKLYKIFLRLTMNVNSTFDTSVSHSLPTPITAWIPWASLRAPRGPVLMEVWTISSTSFGSFSTLSGGERKKCKPSKHLIKALNNYGTPSYIQEVVHTMPESCQYVDEDGKHNKGKLAQNPKL